MIGDPDLKISKLYGMLPAESGSSSEGRTAADNQTVRNVFVVGPDKKIKLMLTYPMTTGRNFDEVLRVLDSMQLTAKHKVATPGKLIVFRLARRDQSRVSSMSQQRRDVPCKRLIRDSADL
jgi:alkyl hydroperoxide reductase subunit AhpC